MTPEERERLCANTARSMNGVPTEIAQRWVAHCDKADPAYGAGVARAIEELARDALDPAGMS